MNNELMERIRLFNCKAEKAEKDGASEVPYLRTCKGRCFFEIRHKPSYES